LCSGFSVEVALSGGVVRQKHLVLVQVDQVVAVDSPVASVEDTPVEADIHRAFARKEQEHLVLVQVDHLAASGYLAA